MDLKNYIRSIPDYPKKGILFSFYKNKPLNPDKIIKIGLLENRQITIR